MKMKNWPIVGGLPKVSKEAKREAMIETIATLLFAAAPLILPPFAFLVIPSLPLSHYLIKIVEEGELFLYATAFVGPLVYSISKSRKYSDETDNPPQSKIIFEFPRGKSIIFTCFFIAIVSSLIFGMVRILPLFTQVERSTSGIFLLSAGIYVLAIICCYSASAYRNDLDEFIAKPAVRDSASKLFSEWKQD